MSEDTFLKAAQAWNVSNETVDEVNLRIHDNTPPEGLNTRADGYVSKAFSLFDYVKLNGGMVLDIGSGTGFIMEALDRYLEPQFPQRNITGLDISETMIEKAKQRLVNSPALKNGTFTFAHYDGLTIPFPDDSFDLVFSVAALQHVPKPYVYNLFFEIKRVLKNDGFAIIHLLPFKHLPNSYLPWKEEVAQQVGLAPSGHWHHYYAEQEIHYVLSHGTGLPHVNVKKDGAWTCFKKTPLQPPSS
jgi:ubiquinone/menaquinone biosynthesis C-methylase UbiE